MATIEDIKTLYSSHEEAGKAYYDQFRAERAQKVLNNETTIESETELSLHLKDVKQELLSGDWRKANIILCRLPANVFCPMDILVKMKSDFDTYIKNNF